VTAARLALADGRFCAHRAVGLLTITPMPDPATPPTFEPSEISEQRAAQLLEWQRDDERERRKEFWGTIVTMIACSAIGCLIMARGFMVEDKELGEIWVGGGILVGQTLILVVLVRAWLRQRDG
jgi:hypothetical protein